MIPTFLNLIELFMDNRTMSPMEYINHGNGEREFSYMIELGCNRTFHVHGIDNDISSMVIKHYVPDEKNGIISDYGGYKERVVGLGKAIERFKLLYCEGNIVKVYYDTIVEQFNCQFQFDSDEHLNIIGYEDCNGEYFDNDMTGEFIYPTLDVHFDKFIDRALGRYRVWTTLTSEEEHYQNMQDLARYQQLNGGTEAHHQFKFNLSKLRTQFSKQIIV